MNNTTPAPEDSLNALRDIHLPEPVGFWPPAIGWWLLALLLLLLTAGVVFYRRHQRSGAVKQQALMELARVEVLYRQHGNVGQLSAEISTLLRRCCLAAYPRANVAGLIGEEWLLFLDKVHGHSHFTSGPGNVLVSAPYQPSQSVDAEALIALTRSWLKHWPGRMVVK